MYKITGAIVMYNNDEKMLSEAINSFLDTHLNVMLYLVDNSPTNELKKMATDSRIDYIHNPSNPGFGASHNVAIQKAFELDSDYHLVLNPDIYFHKGTLEKLSQFMDSNVEVGHVMPKVTYPSGEFQYLCKTNPTFFDLFARGFMPSFLKKIFQKRLDRYEYKDKNYNEIIYSIPYLSGCFMFLRTSTLREVGFFDDRIFMYLEDADLTRRFLLRSLTAYFPDAHVYHHFAKLTHKKLKFKWITVESAFIYFNKWGWLKSFY
ncbi:glycosyltransferase [Flavobacterium gilvum]|uniref:Glycosyl transferase family 2 n=1 Tax=Flavobacterium gilvum TaxID=1492737 RepID=A0AAC9I1D1_9FLAO|nr:glycosyltransferase [Flavobacterium gilvum]AOW08146.1 glycosyl transferase family 2 [Flavobacterium gilvum]KFC59361.1 glycosyl transferase family 2 [Flavobacterium gilvum]